MQMAAGLCGVRHHGRAAFRVCFPVPGECRDDGVGGVPAHCRRDPLSLQHGVCPVLAGYGRRGRDGAVSAGGEGGRGISVACPAGTGADPGLLLCRRGAGRHPAGLADPDRSEAARHGAGTGYGGTRTAHAAGQSRLDGQGYPEPLAGGGAGGSSRSACAAAGCGADARGCAARHQQHRAAGGQFEGSAGGQHRVVRSARGDPCGHRRLSVRAGDALACADRAEHGVAGAGQRWAVRAHHHQPDQECARGDPAGRQGRYPHRL